MGGGSEFLAKEVLQTYVLKMRRKLKKFTECICYTLEN